MGLRLGLAGILLVRLTTCSVRNAVVLMSLVSFAGMVYLTLWLCAKFSVAFPYIGPLAFGARAPAAVTQVQKTETELASTTTNPLAISPRDQGAAPPVYLQILAFVPVCVAFFVACSRYHDHRHAGFDIILPMSDFTCITYRCDEVTDGPGRQGVVDMRSSGRPGTRT